MADIWKLQKSRYLRNGLTDLNEIWYADATWVSQPLRPLKNWIWKIQDNGELPFWKPLNHHISATFWPILIKFGTVMLVPDVKFKLLIFDKNLCTIYFVFNMDGECKFIKTKHYSDYRNMFLAVTFL